MNEESAKQITGPRPRNSRLISFDRALYMLKNGERVTRKGWNGPGQYLGLQVPDEYSKMTLPYIYISTVNQDLVPWLASQADILADDWYVI